MNLSCNESNHKTFNSKILIIFRFSLQDTRKKIWKSQVLSKVIGMNANDKTSCDSDMS